MTHRSEPSAAAAPAGIDFLALPSWQTLTVKETQHAYEVEAIPMSQPPACPHCGAPAAALRPCGTRRRSVRDAPVRGKHVIIHFARRLYGCRVCKRRSPQPLSGISSRRKATDRLVELIGTETFWKTYSLVSEETGAGSATVRDIFVERALVLERSVRTEAPRVLGLDEVYVRGRARCLLTDLHNRLPLEILPKTDMLTLCRCLLQIPQRDLIEVVVIEPQRFYLEVIRKVLPRAAVVVDKWAIWRLAQRTLVAVYKKVATALPDDERLRLTRARTFLQKSSSKLSPQERDALTELFRQQPELGEAYRLRRRFFAIWGSKDRCQAEERYEQWAAHIPPRLYYAFDDLLKIVGNWHQEVFNYFDHPATNAFDKAITHKIGVLQATSPTSSFETIRVKVLYERFVKKPQPPSSSRNTMSLKRRSPKVRAKARRAPAPPKHEERLRQARESRDEFNSLLQRPDERPEENPSRPETPETSSEAD